MALLSRLLVALALACGTTVVSAEESSLPYPLDPADFLVPREKLSTQESDPFLFIGKVVDEKHPQWRDYESVIARFPDASACLLPDERGKAVQDVLRFDWKAMSYMEDIEVCIFRIGRTLSDLDLLRGWLASQGYRVNEISNIYSGNAPGRFPAEPVFSQEAYLEREDFARRTSIYQSMSLMSRWLWYEATIKHNVGIEISADYEVVGVSAYAQTK